MSEFAEKMLHAEPWKGLMMGNHALVRGMLEAGVRVATSYPGSPTPEIAEAIETLPEDERKMYFEFSTNEKVALEVAFGASINGHLSTVFFKSVGLNVAADSLVQMGMLNLIGGMVVILGDDPGANSSQNEQDNRHFARMIYIPVFEPASPEEAYSMFKEAARLSKKYQHPVFLRMTTHVCHAREVIQFDKLPNEDPDWTARYADENGPYWPICAHVFPLKESGLKKLDSFEQEAEQSPFNKVLAPNGPSKKGMIVSAMPALGALECLEDGGQQIEILKLGLSYPMPKKLVADFLKNHDEVVVLEELDRIAEHEIKSLAFDEGVDVKILARTENDDLMKEFYPWRIWDFLGRFWPEMFPKKEAPSAGMEVEVPPRLAQLCPGCGHRSAFHAVAEAMPEGGITVGDIGCHSMGYYDPYNIGTVLLCMGHSNGTAAGLSINNPHRKIVSFIGDSTFFHAGLPGIINAIQYDHDVTLIVMENYTTAMTGHQPHPGAMERKLKRMKIKPVLEALGVTRIWDVDAYNIKGIQDAMAESFDQTGFSVIIARHPCMLKFTRDRRRREAAKQTAAQGGR